MALRLHWEDERYARIYCRDTLDWMTLSWDAQALWMQLNRKADRRGRIDLGRVGRRGVAALLGRRELTERLDAALGELVEDGCVHVDGNVLVIPGFVEAQEAVSSNAKRQREWRERQREADAATRGEGRNEALREASAEGDEPGSRNETSPNVTRGYGTARKAGTARPSGQSTDGAIAPARDPAARWAGGAAPLPDDVVVQAAALDEEADREDRRRGRVLLTLDGWRTVADLAEALKRSAGPVEKDLLELRRQGRVEREERGSPPVVHWRATSSQGQ